MTTRLVYRNREGFLLKKRVTLLQLLDTVQFVFIIKITAVKRTKTV